jgi:hypothetical protein
MVAHVPGAGGRSDLWVHARNVAPRARCIDVRTIVVLLIAVAATSSTAAEAASAPDGALTQHRLRAR